jgi:hypothetical protein
MAPISHYFRNLMQVIPSQPVPCEHGQTELHWVCFDDGMMGYCPGVAGFQHIDAAIEVPCDEQHLGFGA